MGAAAVRPAVPFLAFQVVAVSVLYVASLGSWFAKKTTNMTWTTVLGASANGLLCWTLVPRFGAAGAGAAILGALLVAVVALFWASHRCHPIRYPWGRVTGAASVAGGLVLADRWTAAALSPGISSLAKVGLLACYPIVLAALGVVPLSRLLRRTSS